MQNNENLKNNTAILVVDDDSTVVKFMGKLLIESGYHVTTFVNSLKALNYVLTENSPIDIVVTDLIMPDIDGINFIKKVRQKNLQIPIILMSGDTDVLENIETEKLGINKIVTKPNVIFNIVEIIRQVL